ncbi:AAA family ATPase [Methanolobus profundi]|uniref:Replication factor C small subunit n=1 Tax=Methanolobus profundi TaxID=487685 RepID=A0A1I4QRI0_9EURY|nr:AAA family ATPase [Methanolobus profundi]SFM42637.1 replication factor C small subunit [Methanolobus profundi]
MKDLWTVKYRPNTFDEIIGNEQSLDMIIRLARSNNLPHLVFHGPENSGKSSTAFALAFDLYGDDYERNLAYFNASDFFEQGKSYLVRDKRFLRILGTDDPKKISSSVINVFKEVINEYASMAPMDADFKIIFIDNAESLNSDSQHALRRIMEKYTTTCRFILSTTQPSKLITPLRSRGLQLFFTHVSDAKLAEFIAKVIENEGLTVTSDGIDALVYHARGNIARALNTLQIASIQPGSDNIGPQQIYDATLGESSENVAMLFDSITSKNVLEARKYIDALILEEGLSGQEILLQLHKTVIASNEPDDLIARWVTKIADTDLYLTESANDRIQLEALVAGFCQ